MNNRYQQEELCVMAEKGARGGNQRTTLCQSHCRALAKLITMMVLAYIGLSALGCSNEKPIERMWLAASESDRASDYEAFLAKYHGSTHTEEARKRLSEVVFIPFMAFVGSREDMPDLAKLRLSDELLKRTPDSVKPLQFSMTGSIGRGFYVNGRVIEFANNRYDGSSVETVRFGNIGCVLSEGGMGRSSYNMVFYLSATRSKRDAIVDFVTSATP